MTSAIVILLAWVLDARFGEPRDAWHPVAWFGRLAAPLGRAALSWPPAVQFAGGAVLWCGLVGGTGILAAGIEALLLHAAPAWLGLPLLALALKPAFAWRMLADEVERVDAALGTGHETPRDTGMPTGLDAGRRQLSRLCSRDVSALDAAGVRETAIETLAENFNDSLVAPLFWFAVAGLPGAWAWRAVNTLDAMWGYRGRLERVGKWTAHADDVLAWLPARLSAALLWRPAIDLRTLQREARRTPSPNGGWPMAAMALRLGVRLGKPGVYVLNPAGRAPVAGSVPQALRIANSAARAAFGLAVLVALTSGQLAAAADGAHAALAAERRLAQELALAISKGGRG